MVSSARTQIAGRLMRYGQRDLHAPTRAISVELEIQIRSGEKQILRPEGGRSSPAASPHASPEHNRRLPPFGGLSKVHSKVPRVIWSGRRGSNPRPRPWQGRALPLSYTRIRDVGDRSPATAELCQMQAVNATVRTRPNLTSQPNSPTFLTNRGRIGPKQRRNER